MNKRGISPKLKILTASAMLVALGVIFNCLGTLTGVFDMAGAMLASLLVMLAVLEFPPVFQWLIFLSTGILSVILLPEGVSGWLFVAFLGYYPMLKKQLDKLPRLLGWLLKFVSLYLAGIVAVVVLKLIMFPQGTLLDSFLFIFGFPDLEDEILQLMPSAAQIAPWLPKIGAYASIAFIIVCNICFFMYDKMASLLSRIYLAHWREKLKFFKTK